MNSIMVGVQDNNEEIFLPSFTSRGDVGSNRLNTSAQLGTLKTHDGLM